ncbi:ferredoxin--nitrite reductase [Alkalinema sp. FACHB-956]|uniref:ferredoxin--nitrite reductase n=1 Tax=Alkalinema sp. FACHB-956 TaxID=2692768 RepID=UPI001682BE02|nr:ferredoxin--nitrite reductase [Alkalinema sp. FACHB-956]
MTNTIPASEKLNKFEKFKAEKDGLAVKAELEHFAQIGWEAMDETDRIHRLKWLGIFFRPVTPGKFMMRMRLPCGIVSSEQMRVLADVVSRYGEDGVADITTRQNLQLRGLRLEDIPDILRRYESVGLTSVQSGMDNVRNITASPVAGIDADELYDTRELVQQVQDMITNQGQGNPEFTNLPRKFNIAIAGCRDNSVHAEINDIAFVPAFKEGQLGFNVLVGGFFSASRVEAAIPLNVWVIPSDVVDLCRAILTVYRDNGPRANRQKSRLMWLIDQWGLEKFREEVEKSIGRTLLSAAPKDEIEWDKRDHIGIYKQKQAGLNYVGLCIPVGRLFAQDMYDLARLAEVYGSGELRLTVEQNVIIPNVPDSRLEPLQQEEILQTFSVNPGTIERSLVSCTGAQFCNFALVETKNRALALARELDQEVEVPQPVRIHWTGCPNSCGQPQVADIGLMGTKARKDGKVTEGVDLFTGGKVGKDAHLGTKTQTGIPVADLKPLLRRMLVEQFGATLKSGVSLEDATETPTPAETIAQPAAPVTPATICLAKSGKVLSCTDQDLILDVVEQAGGTIDSSCRAGSCGTCKHKLLSGSVKYDSDISGLSEAEVAEGYILTCSAHPVGNVVLDLW